MATARFARGQTNNKENTPPRRRTRPERPARSGAEALRDSEARYLQLVDALPIAFYACDATGRVTLYNEAAVAIWGRRPSQALWCGCYRMYAIDGALLPHDRSPLALALRDGIDAQGAELVIERPDGTRRSVLVYPHVFRDGAGRATGAVNALVDISERKAAEAELASTKDDLAHQVGALTRMHERFSDVDRRKDVFLATLAHELRNPLSPIRNAMHVIRLAGDNRAAVAETRAMVERQLTHLVRLVDDLLDVSRISRGRIELRRERVELGAVVRQAIETSRALIDHYGHQLDVSIPSARVEVLADRTRLAQVFSNLLNNAAKYTPPGGRIRLEVRAGDEALVSVRDNGIGLPRDMQDRIFEMFTQVDTTLERSRGGLGVGLAIVKRLLELHGGCVEVRSDGPDKGCEFVVRLPVANSEVVATPASAPDFPPMRRPAAGTAQHRILVCDDNVDLASSLAMMLQMLGHEVRTVHDGGAAIEAAAAFAPDIVFLDIGMPRLNGYETCRRIREGPHGQEAVIVALSGWGQAEDKARSREAGMDLHLTKPFDPALLEAMLTKIEGIGAGRAQPAASLRTTHPTQTPAPLAEATEPISRVDAETAVEAARYALYRRILPVLRHGLAGELQSVQFAVDLARRACAKDETGSKAAAAIARIAEQAQAAVGRGQALTEWVRPDPAAATTVGEAVHVCLDLVGTEWSMRGIEVQTAMPAGSAVVRAAPFRELLVAMLVALGDSVAQASDVMLRATERDAHVCVSLRARPAARDSARVSLYRDLRWNDVAALAQSHGVRWAHRGRVAVLRVPLA